MPIKKLKEGFKFSFLKPSPLSLFVIGFLLICFSLYWSYYEKTVLSFENYSNSEVNTGQIKPQRLIIPSVSIDLEIKKASVSGNNWEINPKGASHLKFSAGPGQKGNMIIFGHNKSDLLGNVLNIKEGAEIEVIDTQTRNHKYKVFQTLVVDPSEIWVLEDKGEEMLTLYTCTGLFDSKRFVLKARPVI